MPVILIVRAQALDAFRGGNALKSHIHSSPRGAKEASSVNTKAIANPTVRGAIDALQKGDREAWSALFERDAELYDDGKPRSLETFTRDALGHERFTSLERIENDSGNLVGAFHSDRWGDFRSYFRFGLSPSGKIKRLDIGQEK
jgi:hypothetical protein